MQRRGDIRLTVGRERGLTTRGCVTTAPTAWWRSIVVSIAIYRNRLRHGVVVVVVSVGHVGHDD